MRILHVIPAVAKRYGGPSRAILEMCHALQEQGIEVLIATTDADGSGHLSVVDEHIKDFHTVHIHALFSYSSVAAARICRREQIPYVVRPLGSLGRMGAKKETDPETFVALALD